MRQRFLALNTGSSSIKFHLYDGPDRIAHGAVSGLGTQPVLAADFAHGPARLPLEKLSATHEDALRFLLRIMEENGLHLHDLSGVVHRIVHGGERYGSAIRLDADTVAYLYSLCALAPLHQQQNLLAVRVLSRLLPDLPQYGCFDTGFHREQDPLFRAFALPQEIRDRGVRRYGFHGLSYAWIAQRLHEDEPQLAKGRIVAAHLGNGASLCAMRNGKSIDSTMGMTALDGLPMGTRCGALDAGALIYVLRETGMDLASCERLLYEESGLKGLSGISNDVRVLEQSDTSEARFALDYFVLKVAQYAGMMAVALGGLDALVFTGGIGENAAGLRARICDRLAFLRPFETRVIAANEEFCMVRQVRELVARDAGQHKGKTA